MGQQAPRQRHRRLPVVGLLPPLRPPIVDAWHAVHERPTFPPDRRSSRDRRRPGSGIKADQDKPGEMPQWRLDRWQRLALVLATVAALDFPVAPAGPDQAGGLIAGQPAVARRALLRQRDVDNLSMIAFAQVVA